MLTTFITPFRHFCFNRLLFGICSAPEFFQHRMSKMLSNLSGVVCEMDDVLVFGSSEQEHDERLCKVLRIVQKCGLMLNDKCEFGQRSVKFLGHIIDENGFRADPNKAHTIVNMRAPKNVTDVSRFLGMANQLGKFSPQLADLSTSLHDLLRKDVMFVWGHKHNEAFLALKCLCSSTES